MTSDALEILGKCLVGGAFVVAFALLGHALRPKWFAGLFSAAPSVALASLLLTTVAKGDHAAAEACVGMLFGAAGFVVFALVVRRLLPRMSAVAASGLGTILWAVVALGGYFLVFGNQP